MWKFLLSPSRPLPPPLPPSCSPLAGRSVRPGRGPSFCLSRQRCLAFRRRGGPTLVGKLRRPPGAPLGGVLRSSSFVLHDFVMRWQLLYGLPCVVLQVGMARPSPPLRVVNVRT